MKLETLGISKFTIVIVFVTEILKNTERFTNMQQTDYDYRIAMNEMVIEFDKYNLTINNNII